MNNPSLDITSLYTQESNFEQAINNDIAELWKSKEEGYVKSFDNRSLYWAKLSNPSHTKAILVVNGRIECAAKYQELFYDFFQQGYDIYCYDHRGQGLSDRLTENRQMGYVEEFDDYVRDLDQLVRYFNFSSYQKRYLLAHSMGGNIVTRYLQTYDAPFDAAALTAPMYGINLPWYLKPVAALLMQILTLLSPEPTFAPGQKPYVAKPFATNLLSHSQVRYQWFRDLYQQQPELQLGGATTRWVWKGLMACKQCYLMTRHIKIPLLVIQAGDDQIVSNQAQNKLMKKLARTNNKGELILICGAKHELLFEKDIYRNQAIDLIVNFFNISANSIA